MNKKIILGIAVLLVVVVGIVLLSLLSGNDQESVTTNSSDSGEVVADYLDPIYDTNEEDSEPVESEEDQQPQESEAVSTAEVREEEVVENVNDTVTANLDYANGTYETNTSYALPNGGSHQMDIEISIENDTVTDVQIVFDGDVSGGSTAIQKRFMDAMRPQVIGAKVNEISLSRTGGASLTTGGFNEAMDVIKTQALN